MPGTPIFNPGEGVPFLTGDDHLLKAASDASLNARVGSGYEVLWSQIEGYVVGATLLLQYVEAHGVGQETLIYPIMYLYRHYLELVFKALVLLDSQLRGDGPVMPKGHDLAQLWAECRPVLAVVFSNREGELDVQLDQAERHVHDFVALDRTSQALRYPLDNKGVPFRADAVEFSIVNVGKTMTGLAALLNSAVTVFKVKIEQDEWLNANQAEFWSAVELQP